MSAAMRYREYYQTDDYTTSLATSQVSLREGCHTQGPCTVHNITKRKVKFQGSPFKR